MKSGTSPHWILHEIAEKRIPRTSIDVWPGIERRLKPQTAHTISGSGGNAKRNLAYGWVVLLVLLISLVFVPGVRAFTTDIIQQMGIAFVIGARTDQKIQTGMAAKTIDAVNPPRSLSIEEIKRLLPFAVLLPTQVPADLVNVRRNISEYDPAEAGSGKQLNIEYSRAEDSDRSNGLLILHANDGPISAPPLLAESRQQMVTVNGQPGIYVHGSWQDQGQGDPSTRLGDLLWDDRADDAYLTWMQGGITYLLEAHNLALKEADLNQIAASMARP